ncbi:acetaldehyde dehydrogenase (acetylating) [Candidatus Pantoea floridensis]|uniref:Acetaldehyde dehydrogenase n=1 Tax=Candidatus Pantoea floridensis TaxID=1938870 RepID=A0A286BWC8_9GAMM|nr:acetaldehyde dehydrogenase (acetylating) [Pantoea floridensis]PIF20918.1 acetaldehyde dehydrogenase [Enterobacteriaceae bacterium JKS000233]SOD38434.1 acetaldehyde dehydrogenase [Pantoea floridensis]
MNELDRDLSSRQQARELVRKAKSAQTQFAMFTQQQIDKVVEHIARQAAQHAEALGRMACEETGFGNWQDKTLKNQFASLQVFAAINAMKTVGIIHEDSAKQVMDIGVPLGVICALVPSTNPTSTIFYKTLIALKAGNAIVFSPHPGARQCSLRAIEIVAQAAAEAGAPASIVSGLSQLTQEATAELMHSKDISLILATGGEGMVRAAYASGTPTISGGPGNGPAFIERSADIKQAVSDIITSKTFDNGVICASEQSIIVERCIYAETRRELEAQGAWFMNPDQAAKMAALLLRANGSINPQVVGKSAQVLSNMAGFSVPPTTRVLIAEQTEVSRANPYAREKLCPVLGMYVEEDGHHACQRVVELLTNEGVGHTLVIHTRDQQVVRQFSLEKPVHRILVNTPAALGGIGATTNIMPALTLGCGAIGGGSSSDNVSPLNLINIRKVGYGVRSMTDLRPPQTPITTVLPEAVTASPSPASIFDDARFKQGADDQRFNHVATETASTGDVSSQQVERIIRQVLAKQSPATF